MTGRGDGRLIRPNLNPTVQIGISLDISSPTPEPGSDAPLLLIITARILKSSRPDSPVTFMAHLNPFETLPNRSITNLDCISPEKSKGKHIEIWPRGWPNIASLPRDLRKSFKFYTIHPDTPLVVKHEIPRAKIVEVGLKKGEIYKVEFTNKALGTRWWTFGAQEAMEDTEYRWWCRVESPGECIDEDLEPQTSDFTIGEEPNQLALVVEKGEAEFEVS